MNNFLKSMSEWFQNIYMAVFNTAEITAMRAGQQNDVQAGGGNQQAIRLELQEAKICNGGLLRDLEEAKETIACQKEHIASLGSDSAQEDALRCLLGKANADRRELRDRLNDAEETIGAFKEQRNSNKKISMM